MKRWHTLWTAYLDERLSEQERRKVEARMRRKPELAREAEAWREIRSEWRAAPAPEMEDADAFWRDLRRRLPDREREAEAPPRGTVRPLWWGGLGVATAAALVAVTMWSPWTAPPVPQGTTVEYVDARLPETVPLVYTDAESGWTVVWLSNAELETSNEVW